MFINLNLNITNFSFLLIFMVVAGLLLFVLQYLSTLVKNIMSVKKSYYIEMLSIYECGFEPFFFNTTGEFNVLFYRVSILFLLFDLELVLFFPWMISFSYLGIESFLIVLFFVVLLFWGFFYEWFNGILDW